VELIEAEWAVAVKVTGSQIEAMEKQFKVKVPRDLKGTLRDCGDAFDEMRYLYEAPKVAFYIAPLPSVLRFVIERRTGWKMSLP
jgi:hypothetical protein